MKVLIVTTAFPRWRDDSRAPFILEAARAIQQKGVSIKVIAMHSPEAEVRESWDGIKIYRPRYLPERFEILRREEGGLPVTWNKGRFSRFAIVPFVVVNCLAVVKQAHEVDIIHANWTLSAGCVWLTKWLHRKPWVVTVHGSDIFLAGKKPIIRWLTRIVLRGADKVIAVSKALAIEVARLGVPQNSIEVIPDGVDVKRFHPQTGERDPIILFVGSFTWVKGGDILLHAFHEVAQRFSEYRLVMVGDGPLRNEWEALAKSLNIAEKVTFTGPLGRNEVADWMRRAKLFVLPSRSEGLGVVLLEALASGTPCIGSAVGGIPDIINNEVGCLVGPDDPKILAESIIDQLINPIKLAELSKAAYEKAQREYDWNQVSWQLIDQYHSILR